MQGKNRVVIIAVALWLAGFSLWGILKPDGTRSVSERRPLAAFPELSMETVAAGTFMEDFETYALDQFPMRDQFRTLKAVTAFYIMGQRDNNGIYIRDGHASRLDYPMNDASISHGLDRFRKVYEDYLAGKNGNLYVSVIPDKNYFMAETNGYPSIDYEEFFRRIREGMDYAQYIDITPYLELEDYYATDTHWRQEKITDAAGYLAETMGASLTGKYTQRQSAAPFYGVYYGQSALPLGADTMYYLDSPVLDGCRVYDYETNARIPVYDTEKLSGDDPYEVFLSGPRSLLTIENPAGPADKELIIFRDSFGSSLAPLLAEGYGKITLVDIRYIAPALLGRFIDFDGQDVLFLYSTSVLNNSETIK